MLESFDWIKIGNWVVESWFLKKGKNLGLKNTQYWVFLWVKVKKVREKVVIFRWECINFYMTRAFWLSGHRIPHTLITY